MPICDVIPMSMVSIANLVVQQNCSPQTELPMGSYRMFSVESGSAADCIGKVWENLLIQKL